MAIKIYVPYVMKLSLEFLAYHMHHDNMSILKKHAHSHQCILRIVHNEILFKESFYVISYKLSTEIYHVLALEPCECHIM